MSESTGGIISECPGDFIGIGSIQEISPDSLESFPRILLMLTCRQARLTSFVNWHFDEVSRNRRDRS